MHILDNVCCLFWLSEHNALSPSQDSNRRSLSSSIRWSYPKCLKHVAHKLHAAHQFVVCGPVADIVIIISFCHVQSHRFFKFKHLKILFIMAFIESMKVATVC